MKRFVLLVAVLFTLFIFSSVSQAAEYTIVGVWSAIGTDGPHKGKERAQIEIYEKSGVYEGKYIKLPLNAPGAKCTVCTGDRKDQPLLSMVMIYSIKKTGDNEYVGKIYQTEKGKEFKCKLSLDNPNKLKVQGCIGFVCPSMQYWNRVK